MSNPNEYAEEYSQRERIRYALIAAAIALPLLLLLTFWALPALREFADKSHCYQLFSISGTAYLLYGLFMGLPLLAATVLGLPLAQRGLKTLRDRRSPPLGVKVFRRTPIRRGSRAILIGWMYQIPFLYLLAMAAWGLSQAEDLLLSQDGLRLDYSVCAQNNKSGS